METEDKVNAEHKEQLNDLMNQIAWQAVGFWEMF